MKIIALIILPWILRIIINYFLMIPTTRDLPSFYIGSLPIYGRLILAPMDGYTDHPFRLLCRQQGSACSISEFINGIDIANGHPHLKTKLFFTDEERPFAYQIFDDDPERLLKASLKLQVLNPDFIDINMGCSAKNVSNRGAGAGLLKDPDKIARIISSLVTSLSVPVTAKIRLGWDDSSRNFIEVAKIIEDNGASAISVHARTRKQEYGGNANWDAIGEIKNLVKIPVIGNGDVKNENAAQRLINMTGCDAVMIGRAAIGNPFVFNTHQDNPEDTIQLLDMMISHIRQMTDLYGPKIGVLMFRKHLVKYLSTHLITPDIRRDIFRITDQEDLISSIKALIQK